jgi:hypothetical protein
MFSKVEQEGLNHNPIQLMFNILSSETDLETEKTKVNDIQRLMSVFYIQVSLQIFLNFYTFIHNFCLRFL